MNLSIIGFMASGKSRYAYELAKKTGMKLVNIDREIAAKLKMSIADIFAKYGEERFRELETELLTGIYKGDNQIIDCGGGAVLRNSELIKQNSRVILIDTDFDIIWQRLNGDLSRPLVKGKTEEQVYELYLSRIGLYRSMANEIVK